MVGLIGIAKFLVWVEGWYSLVVLDNDRH